MRSGLFVLAFLICSSVASAADVKPGSKMQVVLQALHLSKDQRENIARIHQQAEAELAVLNKAAEEQRTLLYRSVESSEVSDDELRRLHLSYLKARERFKNARFEELLRIRSVLTQAQREEFARQMREIRRNTKQG